MATTAEWNILAKIKKRTLRCNTDAKEINPQNLKMLPLSKYFWTELCQGNMIVAADVLLFFCFFLKQQLHFALREPHRLVCVRVCAFLGGFTSKLLAVLLAPVA